MAEDKPRPALDDPNAYVLYRYHPSQVAAIIFVVLFGLTTVLHLFQLIKKRTWYFIPLVVGGACTCCADARLHTNANFGIQLRPSVS